jgi:uncharacterized damage-inducible protein DinB
MAENNVEPWLRATHMELDPLRRAVVHALELAREDLARWCVPLGLDEMEQCPFDLPSVGFQLRHIARSLDRLLTYAEGASLSEQQLAALQEEHQAVPDTAAEFTSTVEHAIARVLAIDPDQFDDARGVGRAKLPTTVGGLLIHIAEHTQRHVGQAITTAKVVAGLRGAEAS